MSENHKYIILAASAFIWMLLMLFVVCLAGIYKSQQPQRQSHDTFIIFKQKPVAMTDINTMMPRCRLIPNDARVTASYYSYSSSPSYADRYIKTENKSLYTSSSRLGEGDGEYSGFYRGMLWYNSVFNQYEHRDWLGR
ncbi:hypothetical protein HY792_00745 [Candidatus Desantisbacteria bacterium]|nr:hypothetical protein [Candidatus Desantisbacteria bacterium]